MTQKKDIFKNIQENLKKQMQIKGLTIKELERLSDVSEPTIKRLRTQPVSPNTSIDVINNLANALNISLMDFINAPPSDMAVENEKEQNDDGFIYKFKEKVFEFPAGSKAFFKNYDPSSTKLTKYFFDKDYKLYMLVSKNEKIVAKNTSGELTSLATSEILAVISKRYYEEDINE